MPFTFFRKQTSLNILLFIQWQVASMLEQKLAFSQHNGFLLLLDTNTTPEFCCATSSFDTAGKISLLFAINFW